MGKAGRGQRQEPQNPQLLSVLRHLRGVSPAQIQKVESTGLDREGKGARKSFQVLTSGSVPGAPEP